MRDGRTIAVIIPALDDEPAIGRVLDAIPLWVDDIVIADNGPSDRIAEVAARRGARVVHEPRRGYGLACLAALAALDQPDLVVFLEGDNSALPEEMALLVDPLLDGDVDLVVGSRMLGGPRPGALTRSQRFENWLACWLLRLLWNVRYTDLGPFRAIRFDRLLQLGMRDQDRGWRAEMQVRAAQLKLRVREVPVSCRPRVGGKPKRAGAVGGILSVGTSTLRAVCKAAATPPRQRRLPGLRKRLVVFTRYPEPGRVKPRLIPELGEDGAAGLHQALTAHTLRWAAALLSSEVEVEIRFEGRSEAAMRACYGTRWRYVAQGRGDYGQRMARAFTQAFERGAEAVVAVGTDCPELDHGAVMAAFNALKSYQLVLGPSSDGGYYLIGLRQPVPSLFEEVAWGTHSVLSQTLSRATDAGLSCKTLKQLRNVDGADDLPVWNAIAAR